MAVIYVPRVFGGVLIINVNSGPPPITPTLTIGAIGRDGNTKAPGRDGKTGAIGRDGNDTGKGR